MAEFDKNNAEANESFEETAMRLSGKSEDEAKRTGALGKADDEMESMFSAQHKTANSPAHRVVWNSENLSLLEFIAKPHKQSSEQADKALNASLKVVRKHTLANTLVEKETGKLSKAVLAELGQAGYFGLLVDPKYGGQGATVSDFMRLLTKMSALGDPHIAGLASIHQCIGAVDPVSTFGSDSQKEAFLPGLAKGAPLSAFALTEPGAGSDLTAIETYARRQGDTFFVTGEKLFISNADYGRRIGLVCLVDSEKHSGQKEKAVLIVDLPEEDSENFQVKRYGLHAVKRLHNVGLVFNEFAVPAANLLKTEKGDGLTIAYHGLNLGRTALCANAVGVMKRVLKSILPWAEYRETYGQAIVKREFVQERIARTAAYVVGGEALVSWCSSLLDQGYRGELECIIAKIFGSEKQMEVALNCGMRTHGGRSFLEGHQIGDNLHDFLAPVIYEGEGDMLSMAYFKALAKDHGMKYMEPIGTTTAKKLKVKKPNLINPYHLWTLRKEFLSYGMWLTGKSISRFKTAPTPADMDPKLNKHVRFALKYLANMSIELSFGNMVKYQLKMADYQLLLKDLSMRCQNAVTMIVACMHAYKEKDELTTMSVDVLCQLLKKEITGRALGMTYSKACVKLAEAIVAADQKGECKMLAGVDAPEILHRYK